MMATDALSTGHDKREIPSRPDAVEVPALSIDGVSHAYGARQALTDIGFSVPPASFTALLGLNGAGKSTLFSLITRLFGIQRGHIGIFGHDIAQAPGEALRLLGVVFQPRTLDLDLSVTQNLLYPTAPAARCATSPAARCDVWKSRGRCCTARAFCCSTKRPSASTSRRAPTSSTTSAGSLPSRV
jgi:ABC-type branched-subunit amino acid transport system ATPase component